jgi:hypothetical protein
MGEQAAKGRRRQLAHCAVKRGPHTHEDDAAHESSREQQTAWYFWRASCGAGKYWPRQCARATWADALGCLGQGAGR